MLSTVLIIDKRKELPAKYKKCIDELEASTIITRNLKDAFLSLQNLEPDMVIVSDSIEEKLADFCQKIRALTYNSRPIIIALSKSADTQDRIEVLESGADDFLSEPVNIDEFRMRIKAHLRRDIESNLDNKTLLPNLKYSHKALKRVLNSDGLAVLFADIQNFEEYKKIYTELAGDKLIQTFVAITKSALDNSDFIGQYNETGFIIITNKYKAEKLATFLAFAFDTVVPKFYSEKDVKRGYSTLKGEKYAGMRVNFVSVLIGGMIDGFNLISNTKILLDKLISIKSMAKIPSGSNYVIDRARLTASDAVVEKSFNRTIFVKEKDSSLQYLIRTSLELQGYDVVESIDENIAEQPAIIIIDSKDDLSELESLKTLKQNQNFVNTKFIVTTTVHDKSAILGAGADLYLPKPYEISDLIRWVEHFLFS